MTEGRRPAGLAALYSNIRVRFPPGGAWGQVDKRAQEPPLSPNSKSPLCVPPYNSMIA